MEIQNFKNGHKKFFCLFKTVLLLFLIALTILAGVTIINSIKEGREIASQNTISVTAKGEVFAKPDLALVTFSVVTEEKTVAEALSSNSQKMNEVIGEVKAQGVEEKDLKTVSFNIYPRYEWYERTGSIYPEGERVLVGYEVRQSLEVKIRTLTKIGDIIQAATVAGSNQVGNLQLTIDNEDEFKKEARKQAINKAKEKARELASQLGVNLVRITNFQESAVLPYYYALDRAVGGIGGGEETPQIEAGENLIEVTITITYQIN